MKRGVRPPITGKFGQVSLYIIIGIVILLGVLFLLTTSERLNEQARDVTKKLTSTLSLGRLSVEEFVGQCVAESTREGVLLLGKQGGRLYPDEDHSVVTDFSTVQLGFDKGEDTLPDLVRMQTELNVYVENEVLSCLNGFDQFSGRDIELDGSSIIASIGEETIQVLARISVTIREDGVESQLDDFSETIRLPLGSMYVAARAVVDAAKQNPYEIDTAAIYDKGFDVSLDFVEDTTLYLLSPQQSDSEFSDFLFVTGVRAEKNLPPAISTAQTQFNILRGESVSFSIGVEDEGEVELEDDTYLFDITQTGEVSFTPMFSGEFPVRITATDDIGQEDFLDLTFIVEDNLS